MKTFPEILTAAQSADCLIWSRDGNALDLITDDMARDLRTCVNVRAESMTVEIRTLTGYGKKKNGQWSEYCGPAQIYRIENRRGFKPFMEWIRARATDRTGYPNPPSFSLYKQSTGNYIS